VSGVFRRALGRLGGKDVPADWPGTLVADERVLSFAVLRDGGHLVATSLGLWVPDGPDATGSRRIGWHLISKATWGEGVLAVVEAEETGTVDDAVLLADRPPRRFPVATPEHLPEAVHKRVTGSIRTRHHHDLASGGAWFVQRKVAGRDGVVLQVRPDPGTDLAALRPLVAQVAQGISAVREQSES
jgi:hypothetical protein